VRPSRSRQSRVSAGSANRVIAKPGPVRLRDHARLVRHPANRAVELDTATTDATAALSLQVTIPPTLPPGEHTVVALGIAPDGTTRAMKLLVTVAGTTTGGPGGHRPRRHRPARGGPAELVWR